MEETTNIQPPPPPQQQSQVSGLTSICHKLADFIAIMLLLAAIQNFVSSAYYSFAGNSDKWFSRFALSLICFGISGIILKLRK